MKIITDKNKIYEIARNDPVVHTLMKMVELGQITFEQAMMSGVGILADQCAEMQKIAVDAMAHSIQPHAFQQSVYWTGLTVEQKEEISKIIMRALAKGAA